MREEYTLALGRETEEFEQALIEQRVDHIFEQFYETLVPASNYLRSILSKDDVRALDQLEQGYLLALEQASRSALGFRPTQRRDALHDQRAMIPLARNPQPMTNPTKETHNPDEVLKIRPCS